MTTAMPAVEASPRLRTTSHRQARPTAITGRRPSRDLAVDRLRGLCLVSMTVAHLAEVTDHSSVVNAAIHLPAWVSGAAGFVFLSGVSIGLFWTGRRRNPTAGSRGNADTAIRWWAFNRGLLLAALAIVLNVIGIGWFSLIGPTAWYPPVEPSVSALVTARWSLSFANVMWMYAAFLMAASAIGHRLIARPMVAITGSVALYAVSQLGIAFGPTRSPGGDVSWNLLAWQLLFVFGLVAGSQWDDVRQLLYRRRRAVWWMAAATVATIASLRIGFNIAERGLDPIGMLAWREWLETQWMGKTSLAPGRLVLVLGLGPAAYLICRNRTPLDPLLVPAGGKSLRVYTVSTVVAFLWTATDVDQWPMLNAELAIVVATAAVLATAKLPALGRGRFWSF